MNCKPGDLARVKSGYPEVNVGRIIRVLQAFNFFGGALWRYEGHLETDFGTRCTAVSDDCLMPIDNPGDDAVDESAAWLPPVPTLEPETV